MGDFHLEVHISGFLLKIGKLVNTGINFSAWQGSAAADCGRALGQRGVHPPRGSQCPLILLLSLWSFIIISFKSMFLFLYRKIILSKGGGKDEPKWFFVLRKMREHISSWR